MPSIAYKLAMPAAQVRFRRGYLVMIRRASDQIGGTLARLSDSNGIIPLRHEKLVRTGAQMILHNVFAPAGQPVIAEDGSTGSPYARMLLGECARATWDTVQAHARFLDAMLPDEVKAWLLAHTLTEMGAQKYAIGEQDPFERWGGPGGYTDQQIDDLRIFKPNPLAEYDPPHTWVDPNGYRLSDRIWKTDEATRAKIDALLRTEIRSGTSALRISRLAEQFLLPGRAAIRTRPYGTDASYDAMRLARTEISHAANNAAWLSAYLNPYVGGVDVVRSAQGDPTCPVCPQHATIGINGERLRESYPTNAADIAPYHPHCMCNVQPVVIDDPDTVAARLRAVVESERARYLEVVTPFQADALIQKMLGAALWDILRQVLPIQPPLF